MASFSGYSFNQTIDSDDEDDQQKFQVGKDASIAVIDCNSTMFELINNADDSEDDEESPSSVFEKCLGVIEKLMLERIIHDHKDLVS